MNQELPDVQAGFRKGRGTRNQIANILWIIEKAREFQKNVYLCFIAGKEMATHSSVLAWRIPGMGEPGGLLFMGSHRVGHNWSDLVVVVCFIDNAKAFDCVDHNKLWKILQEIGIWDHLTCLLRNLYGGREAIVKTGRGTMDWFKIGKGVQGCILSPTYLTYMQSTTCKMLGWMNHKLKSRLPGEISATSDMQVIPL